MAYIYYTVTAVILYLLSDWILSQIEQSMGKRLKYRSVIFFFIIMTLSLSSFNLIDRLVGDPPQTTPEAIVETAPAAETAAPLPAAN